MALEGFAVDGLKRAEAHVQCELADFYPTRTNRRQNLRCKVQTCGGSRDRSRPPRKHGLISFAVRGNLIILAPPLVIGENELDRALEIMNTLLGELDWT